MKDYFRITLADCSNHHVKTTLKNMHGAYMHIINGRLDTNGVDWIPMEWTGNLKYWWNFNLKWKDNGYLYML